MGFGDVTPLPTSYTTSGVLSGGSCASTTLPQNRRAEALASATFVVNALFRFLTNPPEASCIGHNLLAGPYSLPNPNPRHGPTHHACNLPHLHHQLIKLIGEQRLRTIRQSLVGLVMDFHHQSIGAHSHRRPRQRSYFIPLTRPVAGI